MGVSECTPLPGDSGCGTQRRDGAVLVSKYTWTAGASGCGARWRVGASRVGVFALMASIGFNCARGGAFAYLGAILVKTCGFQNAKACWLMSMETVVERGWCSLQQS